MSEGEREGVWMSEKECEGVWTGVGRRCLREAVGVQGFARGCRCVSDVLE